MSPDLLLAQVAEATKQALAEAKRADQLAANCRWMYEQLSAIHEALCPDASPTGWQQEVQQAVEAARKLSKQP